MLNKNTGTVLGLSMITILAACGDSGDKPDPLNAGDTDHARSVHRIPAPPEETTGTDGPTAEAVELALDGSPVDISQIHQCAATPGRGLGFSSWTDDHVGDGSAGVRVGGGFEYEKGRVLINYQSKKWVAEEGVGSLSFNRIDTRTSDGHSFVTVEATGKAVAGTDELPFSLTVTCEPGGT